MGLCATLTFCQSCLGRVPPNAGSAALIEGGRSRIVQLDEPRPLNGPERSVLGTLLAPDFPGSAQLRSQMPEAMVVGVCDCGCPTVDISVPRTAPGSTAIAGPLAPYEVG